MNIAVIGMGLIGGSFCRAISAKTTHSCFGMDIDKFTLTSAINDGAIKDSIESNRLNEMDMIIVCLHPQQTINFLTNNSGNFKKGSIVIDSCGVKKIICNSVSEKLKENDIIFIGCHPMAGREFSGYNYSTESLFENASFISTPDNDTPQKSLEFLKEFIMSLGFKKFVVTTPEIHDRNIAFTSQLAHVVSSAYIKSPSLLSQDGFSAGSFQDLTRVAKLNENMWSELFVMNSSPLVEEIDTIIKNLTDYRNCIEDKNIDELKKLLKEGRILKENSLK